MVAGTAIPDAYRGRWFSLTGHGDYQYHDIFEYSIAFGVSLEESGHAFRAECYKLELSNVTPAIQSGDNMKVLFHDT